MISVAQGRISIFVPTDFNPLHVSACKKLKYARCGGHSKFSHEAILSVHSLNITL
jgi:hypothetical protein